LASVGVGVVVILIPICLKKKNLVSSSAGTFMAGRIIANN
jgi:hypothetical protein